MSVRGEPLRRDGRVAVSRIRAVYKGSIVILVVARVGWKFDRRQLGRRLVPKLRQQRHAGYSVLFVFAGTRQCVPSRRCPRGVGYLDRPLLYVVVCVCVVWLVRHSKSACAAGCVVAMDRLCGTPPPLVRPCKPRCERGGNDSEADACTYGNLGTNAKPIVRRCWL